MGGVLPACALWFLACNGVAKRESRHRLIFSSVLLVG